MRWIAVLALAACAADEDGDGRGGDGASASAPVMEIYDVDCATTDAEGLAPFVGQVEDFDGGILRYEVCAVSNGKYHCFDESNAVVVRDGRILVQLPTGGCYPDTDYRLYVLRP